MQIPERRCGGWRAEIDVATAIAGEADLQSRTNESPFGPGARPPFGKAGGNR
jgi:hypothetical protein